MKIIDKSIYMNITYEFKNIFEKKMVEKSIIKDGFYQTSMIARKNKIICSYQKKMNHLENIQ